MQRSLVGSEMCIRDRCNGLHLAESKGKYLGEHIKNKFKTTGYELRN
jgi:hypothetical protein